LPGGSSELLVRRPKRTNLRCQHHWRIFSGWRSWGDPRQGRLLRQLLFINDDVNWVKGNHQIALGGGVLRGEYSSLNDFAAPDNSRSTVPSPDSAWRITLRANPARSSRAFQYFRQQAEFLNLYATDSWRVTPRLTLNFGIRWEPYLPMSVSNNQISKFLDGPVSGWRGRQEHRFLERAVRVSTSPAIRLSGNVRSLQAMGSFDPRGGLAWDPKGDGKTSIRAGYAFGMRTYRAYRARTKAVRTRGADEALTSKPGPTSPIRTRRFQAETRIHIRSVRT